MQGGPIVWASKKQRCVTQSSCEAEFVALTEVAKDILWIRQLLTEMRFRVSTPTVIFIDNQAAQALAENPVAHNRTKHMDIKYFWIRQEINKSIRLQYVKTSDNLADIFTKPTQLPVFAKLSSSLVS